MIESLLTHIFSSANFNRLMFVLAVEGGAYLFSKEWDGWTILSAVIYGIIGYVLVTFISFLWGKLPKQDGYKAIKKEANLDWARNVRSFFLSLQPDIRRTIIEVYNDLDTDPVYYNRKYTSDPTKVIMIQRLANLDYHVEKRYIYTGGSYLEPCISFEFKNGVYAVIFDPVICEEIKKLS